MSHATILVPVETALVYDGTGWRLRTAPPAWWLEMEVERTDQDVEPIANVVLIRPLPYGSCRPGRGRCRRRHVHASARRA